MSLNIVILEGNQDPRMFQLLGVGDDMSMTDSLAQFVITADEGETKTFQVQKKLRQIIIPAGGKAPALNPYVSAKMPWDIIITNKRICFWSPQYISFTGKEKTKQGTATGGYSVYKDINHFALMRNEDDHSSIEIVFQTKLDKGSFVTTIPGSEETIRSILDQLLSRIKQYHSDKEFAAKNHTIDNYKAMVLAELPNVRVRSLNMMGALIYAAVENNNGDEIVDLEITDVKSYDEYGIQINTKGGSIDSFDIDTNRFENVQTQPDAVDNRLKPTNYCPNCGYDLSGLSRPPKFCPKCGSKQE